MHISYTPFPIKQDYDFEVFCNFCGGQGKSVSRAASGTVYAHFVYTVLHKVRLSFLSFLQFFVRSRKHLALLH